MPDHHYLPATHIASFSYDTNSNPRRDRIVYVGDKKHGITYRKKAANVAKIRDLYTLVSVGSNPEMMEQIWEGYERKLNDAIIHLINGDIDARTWVRVLVPFVAGLLVRGPDFDKRYEQRIKNFPFSLDELKAFSVDKTNKARALEFQRMLSLVTVAKWDVIQVVGRKLLITNDLGYAPDFNPILNTTAMAIPLNQTHLLEVTPRTKGNIALFQSRIWVPSIHYFSVPPDFVENLNQNLTSIAQQYIFGSNEQEITRYIKNMKFSSFPIEPEQLGFADSFIRRAHELTWHQLAGAFERDPADDAPWDFEIDFEALAKGWAPILMFPDNLDPFPTVLHRNGDVIFAEFYDPKVYYDLSRIRNFEMMGDYENLLSIALEGLELAKDDEQRIRFLLAKASSLDEFERYDEALEAIDEILQLDPESIDAWINRAAVFIKMEQLDKAKEFLIQAMSIDPENGIAHNNLGILHYMKGEYDLALSEATRAIELLPNSQGKGLAHVSRGIVYLNTEKPKEAVKDFTEGLQYLILDHQKAYCEFQKSIALVATNNYDSASQAINNSIKYDGEFPPSHLQKGLIHRALGNFEDAIEEFSKVIEWQDARNWLKAEAFDHRAQLYAEQKLFNQALEDSEQAILLDNNVSKFHHNRGTTLFYNGVIEAAYHSFSRALEIDPRNAGSLNNRGIIHSIHNDLDSAIADFQLAISIFGSSGEAGSPLRHLAICTAQKGDIQTAHELVEKARCIDSKSPFNDQTYGIIRLYEGQFNDSLTCLKQNAKEFNQNPDIRLFISLPLALMGKTNESYALARKCLDELKTPLSRRIFLSHVYWLRNQFSNHEGFDNFSQRLQLSLEKSQF